MAQANPEIYIACLSTYNNGILYGEWLTVDGDAEKLREQIAEILKKSPSPDAEEWAIHDTSDWGQLSISENPDLEQLCQWAKLIRKHGTAAASFIEWAEDVGIEVTEDEFNDRYKGQYDSPEDFALTSKFIEELYDFSGLTKNYPIWAGCIDWARLANELQMMDHFTYIKRTTDYGIDVFRYMP